MSDKSGKAAKRFSWGLQVLAAAVFLVAGGAKLAGVPMMVATFDGIGVGQWFRYVTGAIEVGAGICLLVPGFAAFGTLLLIPTMICAALAHVCVIGGSPVPAMVLLAVNVAILGLRSDQIDGALNGMSGGR